MELNDELSSETSDDEEMGGLETTDTKEQQPIAPVLPPRTRIDGWTRDLTVAIKPREREEGPYHLRRQPARKNK